MSTQVQTEPIALRVALHPFLVGMSRAQLAIVTDCAMATSFKRNKPFYAKASSRIDFTWLRAAK
jgi:hypothetical protein